MQFSSEFLVGTGIALVLGFAAIAIGLRTMNPRIKKILEIVCWLGVVFGTWLALTNLPKPPPKLFGVLESPPLTGTSASQPKLEIGNTGGYLVWDGPPNTAIFTMAQNQSVKIGYLDNGSVYISTKVEDKDGNLLATIVRNHWSLPGRPQLLDWNYTKDSLEVVAPTGRIVLQVRLLPGVVQLQGEWWGDGGFGNRWTAIPGYGFKVVPLRRDRDPDTPSIIPLFKYPSIAFDGRE